MRNPLPSFYFPFNYDLQKFKMLCQSSSSSFSLNLFSPFPLSVSFTLTSPDHLSGFYWIACVDMIKRKISKNHLMCAMKLTSNTQAAKIFISSSAEKPWNQHDFKSRKIINVFLSIHYIIKKKKRNILKSCVLIINNIGIILILRKQGSSEIILEIENICCLLRNVQCRKLHVITRTFYIREGNWINI